MYICTCTPYRDSDTCKCNLYMIYMYVGVAETNLLLFLDDIRKVGVGNSWVEFTLNNEKIDRTLLHKKDT